MLKKNILAFILFCIINTVNAQYNTDTVRVSKTKTTIKKTSPVYKKHWSFGGNLGLSFWNNGTNIFLGPKAYYHISPHFLMGIGASYIYSDYNNNRYSYSSNSYGGSISAAYRPISFLQCSVEYEGLQTNQNGYYYGNYWNNALYLGVSYVSGNVTFGVRYDMLFDNNSSANSSAFGPVIGFQF